MNDRQTKQLVIAGRASKVEWTRDDSARALVQGWGLFTTNGSKVMRVHRIDGEPLSGINLKSRLVFRHNEAARAWVKQQATAGSDLHRRAWAIDGKTNRQVQDGSVDGTVRTHRDTREAAFEATNVLKACNPYRKIVIRDQRTGAEIDPRKP